MSQFKPGTSHNVLYQRDAATGELTLWLGCYADLEVQVRMRSTDDPKAHELLELVVNEQFAVMDKLEARRRASAARCESIA